MSYINKLKQYNINLFILVIIIYMLIVVVLYKYYDDKVAIEKEQILQKYYKKIWEISSDKIASLASRVFSSIQNENLSINNYANNIEICNNTKCIKYNLYRFTSMLNRNIPDFIYYRIELNGKLLCSNTKSVLYQIDKSYQINKSSQLNISLTFNNIFLHKLESDIKRSFWIITTVLTITLLLLLILLKKSFKVFNKIYEISYQDCYESEIDKLRTAYQQDLQNSEAVWKKKLWNIDFNKQKDLDVNIFFSQKANQIALSNDNSNFQEDKLKNLKLTRHRDQIPCSIVLYQEDKVEEVDIVELINLFTTRFDQEENISIKVSSVAKLVNFSSSEALYQIIYSIIKYLFFLLKKQSLVNKYVIQLFINKVEQETTLYFEYDGYPIMTEAEFLQSSKNFYKTHVNPFLLNPDQIFNLLKVNNLDYKVGHSQFNCIEIQLSKNNKIKTNDDSNVIFLKSPNRKKNE